MSSVNVNDPRIKKVNFRKAAAGDIAMLLGSGGGGGNGTDGAEDTYFSKWEEKNQHLLAAASIKVVVEELRELKLADWGARVDPYVVVSLGATKMKTETFKRSQDAKINQTFNFPLPLDYETRSWELCLEVFDAQSHVCIGAVNLDLNSIFSEDADPTLRLPLIMHYPSIVLGLEPVRWGEDTYGTMTISLTSTVALPKLPLIRDRFAGLIDPQMSKEAKYLLLTEKEKAYMDSLDGAVKRMEAVLPELLESVGGPYLFQMMLGDNYGSSSAASYLSGGGSSSSLNIGGGGSSTPKMKNFLKQGLAALAGSSSSSLYTKGKSGSLAIAGADAVSINDLPSEILLRIFSQLPPWSSLAVRRVNRLWDSLSMPQLPDLWAMFHWFQKVQNAKNPDPELFKTYCTKAFPFIKECARIVQFVTSLNFIMTSCPIPIGEPDKPFVMGPIDSVLSATRVLVYLDLWKSSVMGAINSQANPKIYTDAIGGFKAHWSAHLPEEFAKSAEAISFDDAAFWNMVERFFHPDHTFTQSLPFLITQENVTRLFSVAELIKSQLERRKCPSDQDARYLCCSYILIYILAKIAGPTLQKPKSKGHHLAVLKDYESIIPIEYTRLLIAQGLMKDRSYTKFTS